MLKGGQSVEILLPTREAGKAHTQLWSRNGRGCHREQPRYLQHRLASDWQLRKDVWFPMGMEKVKRESERNVAKYKNIKKRLDELWNEILEKGVGFK